PVLRVSTSDELELLDGPWRVAGTVQRDAELARGVAVVGMALDFRREALDRFGPLRPGVEEQPHSVVRVAKVGIDSQRRPVTDDRRSGMVVALVLLPLLELLTSLSGGVPRRGVGRIGSARDQHRGRLGF